MFDQMTLWDTANAISSLASAAGRSPLASQAGPMTVRSGLDRARASRSPSPEKEKPKPMTGTYGLTFFDSSEAVAPPSSWASRLQQRLGRIGSTECSMTWKASATPAKRPLLRLVPSTPHTVEIDSGSLAEAGYWITASARDWKDTPGMATTRPDGRSRIDQLPRQVAAAMWPTVQAMDANKGSLPPRPHDTGVSLPQRVAQVALYPTPTHRDHFPAHSPEYIAAKKAQGHGMSNLSDIEPLGMTPTGSSDTTEKPGALAPEFVCWLMGFPAAWLWNAPENNPTSRKRTGTTVPARSEHSETPSSRRRRRK